MIRTYRKKPVVVTAIKFTYSADGVKELQDFCGAALIDFGKDRAIGAIGWAQIGTLEDGQNGQAKHIANEGDYIVKGVKGEFYPCKPDIFEQTYEEQTTAPIISKEAFEELTKRTTVTPLMPWYPTFPTDVLPVGRKCPKCGIELSGVMSYSCPHAKCPTGMGTGWSSSHELE